MKRPATMTQKRIEKTGRRERGRTRTAEGEEQTTSGVAVASLEPVGTAWKQKGGGRRRPTTSC